MAFYSTYLRLNLPVSASNLQVLRALRKRLAASAFTRENTPIRKGIYHEILSEHRKAQRLYHMVALGRLVDK